VRTVVFTLNIGNYAPEIRALTYPLLRHFARKIGAEFREITERKWPDWPVVYEKLQIHELGRGYDWIYYFDADALVHPECIDFSWLLPAGSVCHNATDMAAIRFRYDEHFAKDGRNIGTCGWFVLAHKDAIDIWTPTEQTLDEALECCWPTVGELNSGLIDRGHLMDDYVISRNLARLGVKHATVSDLLPKIGLDKADFFWHRYMIPEAQKVQEMQDVLARWRIPDSIMDGP
jgi:hypothetical protein